PANCFRAISCNSCNSWIKKFALDCITLTEKLPNTYLGRHIKGQLIRCSTSVASNYRAAKLGQSKAIFFKLWGS
ncbi:MAG: four helix bundle protein, partial [Bacteroidetes bacterium]|nr:four helix bundle protein [Bacteroidota bacterium]